MKTTSLTLSCTEGCGASLWFDLDRFEGHNRQDGGGDARVTEKKTALQAVQVKVSLEESVLAAAEEQHLDINVCRGSAFKPSCWRKKKKL